MMSLSSVQYPSATGGNIHRYEECKEERYRHISHMVRHMHTHTHTHTHKNTLTLSHTHTHTHSTLFHASAVLLPILGITWILGFFVVGDSIYSLVVEWLFCIFTTLQGVMILIMHCVLNKDVSENSCSLISEVYGLL